MHILLISFFFPPDKSVGGFRASSLAKYFYEKGLKVDLITSNIKTSSPEIMKEYNLERVFIASRPKLREWGYRTKILAILELLKLDTLLFFPDVYYQWIDRAIKKGEKILKDVSYDAIIATSPPISVFFVGYALSKKFNLPLILDYRDPWNGQHFKPVPWKPIKKKHERWEKKIASSAKMIVTVGEQCAHIISNYTNVNPKEIKIIYNGFFAENWPADSPQKDSKTFKIGYFGNIYLLRQKCFIPFLHGLAHFAKKNNLNRSNIQLIYAGNTSRKTINRMLKKAGAEEYFVDLGILEKNSIYEKIRECHLCLLLVPPKAEYALPTKIFDYMANNTHILIVGQKGETKTVCDNVKQHYTIVSCDPKEVETKLEELYNKWKHNKLQYGCDRDLLMEYERKNLAFKYADLIKEMLADNKG